MLYVQQLHFLWNFIFKINKNQTVWIVLIDPRFVTRNRNWQENWITIDNLKKIFASVSKIILYVS